MFYGKSNANYDKGSEAVFGFTSAYDVECWEFKNNTSDACNFLGEIPSSWGDDFEARYPDGSKNISRFKLMHDWVVSTAQGQATGNTLSVAYTDIDGNTHTIDNAAYRLAKFKTEFEDWFNMHYSLIYYVYTFFALMIDQRAKNMFLTYWGKAGKYYPYFYDNDSCMGVNNEGGLVFDYYLEDTDQVDGANVYNGQNSTLWVNFRQAFPDEIKETYQNLRSNSVLNYDELVEQFITNGSDKWSESIYNEDGDFKYVSMLRSDNDATNLQQVRGTGEEHFRYFIENRLNYCDSKWYASDYANDYVVLRIYTPVDENSVPRTDLVIPASGDITVIPYSHMYAGARWKANGTLYQKRVSANEEVYFESPREIWNDTEFAVYGASQLSSLGDLAPLYCGYIDVSKAIKLVALKVGDGTEGYSNTNLNHLSVGTNRLLKTIDIQNCPNFTQSLVLTGCPNIEEVYANGSGITSVELADYSNVRILQLPATVTNLTLKGQHYVEELTLEGYSAIKTLWIEDCPTIDSLDILSKGTNIERARLTNVDWSYDDTSAIYALMERNIAGIDENGTNTSTMWVDGKCHIEFLTGAELAEIRAAFPYLTITYTTLTSQLIFYAPVYLSYTLEEDGTLTSNGEMTMDENGVLSVAEEASPILEEDGTLTLPEGRVWAEVHRQTITNGGNGTDPVSNGTIETPTLESTPQFDFTFNGWSKTEGGEADSTALLNVEGDRIVYAAFESTIRSYTVKFYNGTTLLETHTIEYGSDATYTGSTPKKEVTDDFSSPEDFEFTGWKPEPTNIQGDTNCYAQYYDLREITDDWSTIAENCLNGTATDKYAIGSWKNLYIGISELPYDFSKGAALVMNNELHILGGVLGYKLHYKWTGTNWIEVSTLPLNYYTANKNAVVYNNEIHIVGNNNTIHYKWDGSEWTEDTAPPSNVIIALVLNDYLYAFNGYVVLRYDGTTWIDLGTNTIINYNDSNRIAVYKDGIYSLWNGKMHKFDGVSWTLINSNAPNVSNFHELIEYNGELHIMGGNTSSDYRFHKKWNGFEWTTFGIYETIPMEVVGHNHDELADGVNKWESVSTLPFDGSRSCLVEYQNEIHLLGGGINTAHYKYSNGAWTSVATLPINFVEGTVVVYNDEIHILGGTSNCHYKWNNTDAAWTEASTLPYTTGEHPQAIVWNNELHLFGGNTNATKHYKWDGTIWSEVSTSTLSGGVSGNTKISIYKNEPYIASSNKLHKFNGTNWEEICSFSIGSVRGMHEFDNNLYLLGETRFYKYDGETVSLVGKLPFTLHWTAHTFFASNEIHIAGGAYGARKHFKWSTNRWESVDTANTVLTDSYSFEHDNNLYIFNEGGNLYRWDGDGEYTLITTPPFAPSRAGLYKGDIYIRYYTTDTTNPYYMKLWKYNWSEWIEVCDLPNNTSTSSIIEYNGRLHIIGGNYVSGNENTHTGNNHWIWDGANWNQSYFPSYSAANFAVIYNNELYATVGGKFYKWDETSSLWISDTTIPDIPNGLAWYRNSHSLRVHNNEIYAHIKTTDGSSNDKGRIVKYNGIEWKDVSVTDDFLCPSFSLVSFRHQLHLFGGVGAYRNQHWVMSNPKATLTFMAKNLLSEPRVWNSGSASNAGGWEASELRQYLTEDLFPTLPTVLQSNIQKSKKLSDEGRWGTGKLVVTNDTLWSPSYHEVSEAEETKTPSGQGTIYLVFTDAASLIRRTVEGVSQRWMTRSTNINSTYGVFMVNPYGKLESYAPQVTNYVLIGFCL